MCGRQPLLHNLETLCYGEKSDTHLHPSIVSFKGIKCNQIISLHNHPPNLTIESPLVDHKLSCMPWQNKKLTSAIMKSITMKMIVQGIIVAVAALLVEQSSAWSTNQKAFRSPRVRQPSSFVGQPMNPSLSPLFPKNRSTKRGMLKNPNHTSRIKNTGARRGNVIKLSNSVLASSDTLPSFKTAHGLLSPETVIQLEGMKYRSEALNLFLRTYRREGPLSCVQLLSDPDVLPHLTRAMRDIAA